MIFYFNKLEIDQLLTWVIIDHQKSSALEIIKNNVSINGNITFKKKLKIGNIVIKTQISPLDNGDIELDIKDASIAGLNIFGVIRKKAGELIVSSFNQFFPQCTTWKNHNGNIQVHIPGVIFKQFEIVGENILIELLI
jgi:hypothetical protein